MAVPRLSLDRPFTYLLEEDSDPAAGTGSLVSVPFHGRTVKGWILGPGSDLPAGRLMPIRKVRSQVRFFDRPLLRLFEWMRERYIAPLSTIIERTHPPRVVGEEAAFADSAPRPGRPAGTKVTEPGPLLPTYGADRLLDAGRVSWLRPLPAEEAQTCVAAVSACLARGKQAIVLVPEAEPLPATAAAVLDAFADRAVAFLGGDDRSRYRTWLQILSGQHDVVVGTRPAVFAPVSKLGLIWISREVHTGHREERAPYYHVRDVAAARAGLENAAAVLAALSPSVETLAACRAGDASVFRASRGVEREAAPLVETTPPAAEDRSPRLATLLKNAKSAALVVSRPGYGVARVCRSCGSQAACARCRGQIVMERGSATCRVCSSPALCAVCNSGDFGIERGGVERIAEWAGHIGRRPVRRDAGSGAPPGPDELVVGTAAAVKDFGPLSLDVVAILDPDRALANPGVHAGERALATWMEAAAWAGPRRGGGRVLAQTRRPAHRAIQSLIRWDPVGFLEEEGERRTAAGFPPADPLFRITGDARLPKFLQNAGAGSLVSTTIGDATVCLATVPRADLSPFSQVVRELAADGIVDRVDAEPQL
ncbi:MAG TPA: hypothetical protein VF660_01010 [Actinomycetota bacterium]